MQASSQIKAQNLSFQYDKKSNFVLQDLTFEIKPNTITTILGLNGCGKTTLIKMLAGLNKPTHGTVYIGEEDIFKLSSHKRSKKVAYVSQNINVANDFKVIDYITFSKNNTTSFFSVLNESAINKIREEAQEMFGLEKLLDKNMNELSGGERQIICIFAAVIQDSDIIVLDEPTSALDIKNQHKVLDIIKKLKNDKNKTIIFSTHNPNHALLLESDVIVIHESTIKHNDSAKNIVSVEKLKPIYGQKLCLSKEQPYEEISFKD